MELPGRHGTEIGSRLELQPLPINDNWDGSIAYLDRDGVLNFGKSDYINTIDELTMIEGAGRSVGKLRRAGFRTCLVTNQSPIGRGLWGHDRLEEIHNKLQNLLLIEDSDAVLDLILYSHYTPWSNSYIRKPRPGMLEVGRQLINAGENGEAVESFMIAEAYSENRPDEGIRSCIVGDRDADIGAGLSHGVRIFHVDEREGLPSAIDRILDDADTGDQF